ncbi:MAG: hypothetical protein V1906_03100 [Candidatus Woesearchaeota archaeon]
MADWLRKTIIGLISATTLYTCGYVGGGFLYDIASTSMYIQKSTNGKFDRDKDRRFTSELNSEVSGLEAKLSMNKGSSKTITLDIYVSENVKHFFDSKDTAIDNNAWVGYVRETVESLNEYGKAGIGFRVGEVMGVMGEDLSDFVMYYNVNAQKKFDRSRFSLILVPQRDLQMLGEGVAGWAESDSKIMAVTVTENRQRNRTLVLHEMGHLLGLRHTKFNEYKRGLLDPYCIFYKESLMVPGLHPCTDSHLKPEEVERLRKLHTK